MYLGIREPGHDVGHDVVEGVALLGELGEEELGEEGVVYYMCTR